MGKGKDKDKKHKGKKGGKEGDGLHIPKPLRKAGKEALKLAKEPAVAEIVAAALLSAAAALRENKAAAGASGKGADKAADAAARAGRDASKLGEAMRGLALDLARRALDSWEGPAAEQPASGKKKGKGGGRKARAAA